MQREREKERERERERESGPRSVERRFIAENSFGIDEQRAAAALLLSSSRAGRAGITGRGRSQRERE